MIADSLKEKNGDLSVFRLNFSSFSSAPTASYAAAYANPSAAYAQYGQNAAAVAQQQQVYRQRAPSKPMVRELHSKK